MIDVSRRGSLAAMLTMSTSGSVPLGQSPHGTVVSVMDFGAVGDGRADDTAAFRAALGAGAYVLVPPAPRQYRITRPVTLQRPGQRLVGFGPLSRIVFDPQTGRPGNLFITQQDDSGFSQLHLMPGGATNSLFEGWAIAIADARRVVVEDCRFSAMRRGGVLLSDSNDCRVIGNSFIDSVVKGDGSERQAVTGYDILVAGASSRNIVQGNQCFSGVGVAIGCQTVTAGKSQRGNIVRDNVITGYPCYGIMVYLSTPTDSIDGVNIEGNVIEDISGSIWTDGKTLFYGCGIYLQTCNDMMVTGNRILRTNTDRRLPFSGSAVPAAIGISGFGNAVVSGNIIDTCHHGVASIQTTAPPEPGDGTIVADNLMRNCDGAGVWLADGVAATVHDNRLIATPGKGTHGIFVRHFASTWMDAFSVRGNDVANFAVGVEVSGAKVPKAEISSNRIRGATGNAIYSAAATSIIHLNETEGRFGISIAPTAVRGSCRDNVVTASTTGIIDDGGSGIIVEDNMVIAKTPFSTSIAQALSAGSAPAVLSKRWFRKQESSPIAELRGGFEGQQISIIADAPFVLRNSSAMIMRGGADVEVARGTVVTLARLEGVWRQMM